MSIPSIIPDDRLTALSHAEIARYSRHLLLAEVGLEGQQRLKSARVLLIGTGGLGAPVALYLAAAGVGTIGIVDFDFVEVSNLQRQIIHSTKDIDRPKVASAKDKIRAINPDIEVVTYNTQLNSKNALDIIRDYDIVVDGTDNYPTRYLINDACVLLGKPNVYGSIFQFEGQASVFYAKAGPCYRCLYPTPPPPGLVPSCAEGGVVGVLPGIIGTIQAAEAIKLIVGGSESLVGRLLLFDVWEMKQRELKLEKDAHCPVCGEHPTIHALIDYEEFCGLKPNEEEVPIESVTAHELKAWLDAKKPLQLIDIREPHERAIVKFPDAKVIPLGQIVRRIDEFDPAVDAVFLCKIGQRSQFAMRALQRAGYTGRVLNLKDGINAWAQDVDTRLPQY
ncbi:molybdenum cofactor biosynthesis protein MoeB [Pectobacterium betavasculorum]|uniref:Molybdopterin-synthase adenylyltransferase n=1 Tax=Pectobacterium betavasculorum TaxID=55207 RepID=A0A093RUA1_9GAMM|nr:molybdopterin-synthase adenylyltransferase MoeB [Pectobacterium betavasculorum]KFX04069.1 molybdenum cofactor biosynthesis protein MoeB [Pectobacterium betavasculorum]